MSEPTVSVIIPTYNRKDSLLRTLESLARQTYPADRFEVIVVDDGGTDGTASITERAFPFALRYLRQENQGEIVARNSGAACSTGEILIFLDDDIEVVPEYIETLIETHNAHQLAVVLGTLIEVSSQEHLIDESKLGIVRAQSCTSEAITFIECMSGIVSISRDGFFQIGAMQPLIKGKGRNIWGGIDFGYRAYQQGFGFWRAPRAVAYHYDEALESLQACSQRQYRVSSLVHHLFAKYPALKGQIPMFQDKGPIAWRQDSPALILRKLARQIASSRLVMGGMEHVVPLLERHVPNSTALRLLYRWIVSGYIYRGYRVGLSDSESEKLIRGGAL